jgi:hypothetical protein
MKSGILFSGLLAMALFLPQVAVASETDSIPVIKASTLHIIKWNPIAMFDMTPAAQFSYEYPWGLNRTLQHEVGFISHTVNPFLAFSRYLDITGFKLRTEIRYYTGQGKGKGDFYLAPELNYKYYSNKSTDWFSRYDGSYEQLLDYVGKRHYVGGNIKLGKLYYNESSPVVWDIFCGFGIKYRYITSNLPEDAVPQGPTLSDAINELYYMSPGGDWRFNVTAGIRIGYVLPKNWR